MVQGETSEAGTPTIHVGATPSGLISNPSPPSPIFMPDAVPATTLPIYPGLGRALAYSVADWVMIVVQQRYSVISVRNYISAHSTGVWKLK